MVRISALVTLISLGFTVADLMALGYSISGIRVAFESYKTGI